MAIKVKSAGSAARKFVERAGVASGDYTSGVQGTTDQASKSAAAEEAYKQGVQQAIQRGARKKGIEKAGNQKWQERASSVGAARYGAGVAAAESAYEEGVKPYLDTISGLTLPPRGPKGSPENYERAKKVGEALRQKKVGGTG